MVEIYQKYHVNAKLKYNTVKRMEKILDRPLMRGFDKHINILLDALDGEFQTRCIRCMKIQEMLKDDS